MRNPLFVGAVAAVALAAAVGASAADGASVTRETVTESFTETVTNDCGPAVTGTLNGTGVTITQSVQTARGFRVTGTSTGTGRIDWSDGSYTLIDSIDRFSFEAVGKGTTIFAETHMDSGDNYTADGVFSVRQTFHEVEHITVVDGVVQVDLTKGHFHVFGIC
jgi:hypothetical protein